MPASSLMAPTTKAAVEAQCNDQAGGIDVGAAVNGTGFAGAMVQTDMSVDACMRAHGYAAQ